MSLVLSKFLISLNTVLILSVRYAVFPLEFIIFRFYGYIYSSSMIVPEYRAPIIISIFHNGH